MERGIYGDGVPRLDRSRIQTELVRSRERLGLRCRLPELRISAVIFKHGKHAGVQVVE